MPDKILLDSAIGTSVEAVEAAALLDGRDAKRSESPVKGTVCSNCHTALRGRHCHHCGQVADTYHRPVWALLNEMIEGFFGLDGRFWKTVPSLLFRPGQITSRYLKGIRQPYMTPIRLFLLSSLLFFLVFALATAGTNFFNTGLDESETKERLDEVRAALEEAKDQPDDAAALGIALAQAGLDRVDSETKPSQFTTKEKIVCGLWEELVPESKPTVLCRSIKEEKERNATDKDSPVEPAAEGEANAPDKADPKHDVEWGYDTQDGFSDDVNIAIKAIPLDLRRHLVGNIEKAVNDPAQYKATLSRWAPRLVFILAPVYGLILALSFFWRRDLFIYDHMVVALHFHAFLFLFLVLLVPFGYLVGAGLASLAFVVWSNYYLYRVMRTVYGAGRAGAVIRVIAIDFFYQVLLLIAFVALLLLGIVFV